jgi:hypothetical protein
MAGGNDGAQGFPPHLSSVYQVKALVAGEYFHVVPATNFRVDRKTAI